MAVKEFDARKVRSVPLPPSLRGGKLYISETRDTLIVKKTQPPDFGYVRERLKQLKNKISKRDIERASGAVRSR